MSYIKKESLLKKAKELQGKVFGAPLIVRAIEEAPTANVVEVVRCKDCKYASDCEILYPQLERITPNDYCSYGERRTD